MLIKGAISVSDKIFPMVVFSILFSDVSNVASYNFPSGNVLNFKSYS